MSEEKELNMDEIVAKALEAVEAREAERKAKEEQETALYEAGYNAGISEKRSEDEAVRNAQTFSVPKVSNPLEGDHTGKKAFVHWMKTGKAPLELRALEAREDEWQGETKAGLQEGNDPEGGYLVPDDFYADIIEKRDERSWPRQAGVKVIPTNLAKVNIPTESTEIAQFSVSAEEATYATDLPVFGQVAITVHKMTKEIIVSDELLEDDAAGLESWMSSGVARAWALTESKFCATGTGSSQPEGVFVGGDTNALTFDSSGNITADEIPELFYKLKAGYRQNSVWLMDPQTEAYLRKIRDANNFVFPSAFNYAYAGVASSGAWLSVLLNRPVFNDDSIDTIASAKCVIMVGDPEYYALVERRGLRMRRNPYLHMQSGQVGFYWDIRWGGAVLQEEAWAGGIMA